MLIEASSNGGTKKGKEHRATDNDFFLSRRQIKGAFHGQHGPTNHARIVSKEQAPRGRDQGQELHPPHHLIVTHASHAFGRPILVSARLMIATIPLSEAAAGRRCRVLFGGCFFFSLLLLKGSLRVIVGLGLTAGQAFPSARHKITAEWHCICRSTCSGGMYVLLKK